MRKKVLGLVHALLEANLFGGVFDERDNGASHAAHRQTYATNVVWCELKKNVIRGVERLNALAIATFP